MLTSSQQQRGRRTLLWFGLFNSLSFTLVTGNMISLYLLRLGAGTTLIGLVASFVYLSFFFLIPGRALVPRVGVMKLFAWAWLLRYIVIMPILLAPLFLAAERPGAAFALVAAGVLGFQTIRGFGIVANTPMFNGFATPTIRGRFISQFQMIAAVVSIISGTVVAFMLGPDSSILRYLFFLASGIAFGLFAAGLLFSLPELEDQRESAREPLRAVVSRTVKDRQFRFFLGTFFLLAIASGIGRSFMILFAKQAWDFSDRNAFLMIVIGNAGTFTAGYLGSVLLDRLGAKPLILFSVIIFIIGLVVAVFVMPFLSSQVILLMAIAFLLTSFGFSGGENSFQAYFFGLTKPADRLNLGVLYFVTLGAGGTLGALVAGVLLDGLFLVMPVRSAFQVFLVMVLALLVVTLLFARRLPSLGAETFRDTLGVIFSLRDLRAVTSVNRLERSETLQEERSALRGLMQTPTARVAETGIERLSSPSYVIRSEALDLLMNVPYTDQIQEALIEHLREAPHTTASQAARILGLRGNSGAIRPLRQCLESDDHILAGRAAIALCRLGDEGALERIREMLKADATPTQIVHAAAAMQLSGAPGDALPLLQVLLTRELPGYVADEMILAVAHLLGFGTWFYPRYTRFCRGEEPAAVLDPEVIQRFDVSKLDLPGELSWPAGTEDPRTLFLLNAYAQWKNLDNG